MPAAHHKNPQRTTSHIAVHGGVAPKSCTLHHNGSFEPGSHGPEVAEQLEFTGGGVCGLYICALKKQNPTRDNSKHIMKILRVQQKNSEKKECFFWLGEPNKLLKTHNIIKFLRKTNPSEPDKWLKTNNIRFC